MTVTDLSPERQKALEYLTVRAEAMPGEQVLARFRAAAGELEALLDEFDEAEARTVVIPGEWSAAQVVDHLAQTTARNADELRHLLDGRRPPAPPVYEALVSGAAHRVPWDELKAELAEANGVFGTLLGLAARQTPPPGVTIRTILIINRTLADGSVEPEQFDADLGWKGYALTARLHLLDHRTQVKKLLRARGESVMTDAIRITKTATKKDKPKDKDLAFGNVFTDHMFVANFQEEKGWYDPRVEPYAPFALDPATAVLHYGQSLFEGLKAFRGKDGKIRLFRPQKHVERLNRTAQRMTIPPIDPELILRSWTTLVDVDRDWVPSSVGTSLYIRPTVIASEPFLGVRPAKEYLYYVILSPVGPYYPEGLAPTKIKVIDNYVRAVAGGLGEAKTSANYAASLYAAEEAKHEGFTQVLWLDGVHHKYIEEVGTSNIMLKIGDEVITPPLAGTILAGVTRDTALALMRGWGTRVSERAITIDDVVAAARNGTLREVWATGTAAVISPVGELAYKGERIVVNGGRIGETAQKLYDTIVSIQYGATADEHGWSVVV